MYRRGFRFGDTIFLIDSEMEMIDSDILKPFEENCGKGDYQVQIRWAKEDEETPDSLGFVKYKQEGNYIYLALNYKKLPEPTVGQIFIMIPVRKLLFEYKEMVLHSSYVLYKGHAILFCGPSQIGKSTQADLWEQYRGAEVINGDRTLLFFRDSKVYAGGYFACGTSGICKNATAPVSAIVLLEQGKENTISSVNTMTAFRELLVQCAYDVNDREEIEAATSLVAKLIENTKILRLICKKDESAVEELEKYL